MKIIPNGIAVIEGDTHISKWVEQSGRLDHDQNMLPLLDEFIKEGDTVVDCGAFIGDHTKYYLDRVGKTGMIYAFEPNPEAFACLCHNINSDRANLYEAALSDAPSNIGIAKDANAGASHCIPNGSIVCVPLDNLSGLLHRCDFIKMDCEGMEPLALKGAAGILHFHRPTMLIEVNEAALARQGFTPKDITDILDRFGYTYRNIYAEQRMSGPQYDIICIHKERA